MQCWCFGHNQLTSVARRKKLISVNLALGAKKCVLSRNGQRSTWRAVCFNNTSAQCAPKAGRAQEIHFFNLEC